MVDIHCHIGYSAAPVEPGERFSFEPPERLAYDSYMSERMVGRWEYRLLRAMMGVWVNRRGPDLDAAINEVVLRHVRLAQSVDRVVALAFDQYHTDAGEAVSPFDAGDAPYSDIYTSNTLVHRLCQSDPDRFLFGASIHPYRRAGSRTAIDMLDEVAAAGAVLIKWLPLVQNIRADDDRTVAFLRRAAQLRMPMLIHYGGEKALTTNHPEQADPSPLFKVLKSLRTGGVLPTVVIAHFATPSSWPVGRHNYFEATAAELLGEFANEEVYCDTSAMGLFTRARWLKRLLRRPELHPKLVHGSDFPIPVNPVFFLGRLRTRAFRVWRATSWIERDYRLKVALGLGDEVMTRAWDILRDGLAHRTGLRFARYNTPSGREMDS